MHRTACLASARAVPISLTLVLLLLPASLRADVAGARKLMEQTKENLRLRDWDACESNLKLAEAEVDDAPAADKQKVLAEIAEIRKEAVKAHRDWDRPGFIQSINRYIESAKSNVTVHGEFERAEEWIEGKLNSEEGKFLLTPDEIEGIRKQLVPIRKVAMAKKYGDEWARLTKMVDELEPKFPELLKKLETENEGQRGYLVRDFQGDIGRITNDLTKLPKDDPKTKGLQERCDRMSAKLDSMLAAGELKGFIDRIDEYWKTQFEKDTEGWETEQVVIEAPKKLEAPKTTAMVLASSRWLDFATQGDTYNGLKDQSEVRSRVEKMKAAHDKAVKKINDAADEFVARIEKTTETKKQSIDDLRIYASGQINSAMRDQDRAKPYEDRIRAVADRIEKSLADSEKAHDEAVEKASDAAKQAWPKLVASVSAPEMTDPSSLQKGQVYKVTGWQNRMGWDYRGTFDWGITLNGRPIIGVYAPHVNAAFDAADKQLNGFDHLISERMDVIVEVTGTGQVERRVKTEVRDAGNSRIGELERWDPIDCTVVKVIALRGGPVAVGADGQAADAKGAIAPVAAGVVGSSSISSGGGWVAKILWTIVGLLGAGVAFVKAKPQTAAQMAGANGTTTLAAVNQNLDYIGIGLAIVGVLWLLAGWVVYELLPATALIACGAFACVDLLRSRGLIGDPQHAKLKALGPTIAAAAAGVAVLHLFVGQWILF